MINILKLEQYLKWGQNRLMWGWLSWEGGHNAKGPLALRGHFWWSLAPGWMAADQRKLIKIQKLQRFWPQIVTAQSFTLGWQLLLLISNQTFPNNLICSLQILPFLSSFKGIWIYYIFPNLDVMFLEPMTILGKDKTCEMNIFDVCVSVWPNVSTDILISLNPMPIRDK